MADEGLDHDENAGQSPGIIQEDGQRPILVRESSRVSTAGATRVMQPARP